MKTGVMAVLTAGTHVVVAAGQVSEQGVKVAGLLDAVADGSQLVLEVGPTSL